MDRPAAPSSETVAVAKKASLLSRWTLPRLPLVIGVAGLGTIVTAGTWFKRQADARQRAEATAIRAEVAAVQADVENQHARFDNLRWNAARMRTRHASAGMEPPEAWTRERSRLFDGLIDRIDRTADERLFATMSAEIETQCAHGEIAAARENLAHLPRISFPPPEEFRRLQWENYLKPLAQFSRQNPSYYRAFQQEEPEAANADIAVLRAEISASDLDTVTPQLMLELELLGAVAPPGDPVLADWSAVISASDFFENPDAATLGHWRKAQRALRAQDPATAVAHMQAILRTTVRTRQPFRAAYGRAILRNRPDDTKAAYPFLLEAAGAGDADARAWVANQDTADGRPAQAARWLETSVLEGDMSVVPQLLSLYATLAREGGRRDEERELGVLQRIVVTPDAPPLAWLVLARLYDSGGVAVASASKAYECYVRAAEKNVVPAWPEVARCCLHGTGTAPNFEQALAWAARAFESGEQEASVPILIELMEQAPERAASTVVELLEHVQVAATAGYQDTRIGGPSMTRHQVNIGRLETLLARYLDQKGHFGQAARLYAISGSHDPVVTSRYAELTLVHPCETCGGKGKIETFSPCPTCGGKGTVVCNACDGRGYNLVPGTPPCSTCGGSGTMEQDGRVVTCAACGGTGKGKGSVIKQECTHCAHGRAPCPDCEGGRIKVFKECPDCHGTGSRALADR